MAKKRRKKHFNFKMKYEPVSAIHWVYTLRSIRNENDGAPFEY